MTNFEEMVRKVSYRFDNKIKKFCEPLVDYFGLSHFWFQKITHAGNYSLMGNYPTWMEYFFSENLHLTIPHFRHPDNFSNGISLVNYIKEKQFQNTLQIAREKFNIHFSLLIMNKTVDGIESFGFALNSSDEMQHLLLLNEQATIRLFTEKFREEHRILFDELENNQVNMAEIIGADFFKTNVPVMPKPLPRHLLIKHLGIDLSASFTLREIDVIKQILKGYSASHIANSLFLSRRTIEHYIEKIKDKLICFSKVELVQKLRLLDSLGIFNTFD